MCFSLQREGGAYVRSPLQSLEFLLVYSAICQYVAFLATVFFFFFVRVEYIVSIFLLPLVTN